MYIQNPIISHHLLVTTFTSHQQLSSGLLTSLQVSLLLLFSPAKGVILLKLKADHVTPLLKILGKVLIMTLQSTVKSASHPEPSYYLLLFFVHSILAIPGRIHYLCLGTLELFPLFEMLSTQILTWLSLPFKSLPKYHSQEGTPSLPHFKLSHLKKKKITSFPEILDSPLPCSIFQSTYL